MCNAAIVFIPLMHAGEAKGPFIFTPFAARREPAVPEGPVQWVAGETATVEVDISNPTTVPIKVGLTLKPLFGHRVRLFLLDLKLVAVGEPS